MASTDPERQGDAALPLRWCHTCRTFHQTPRTPCAPIPEPLEAPEPVDPPEIIRTWEL